MTSYIVRRQRGDGLLTYCECSDYPSAATLFDEFTAKQLEPGETVKVWQVRPLLDAAGPAATRPGEG